MDAFLMVVDGININNCHRHQEVPYVYSFIVNPIVSNEWSSDFFRQQITELLDIADFANSCTHRVFELLVYYATVIVYGT